VVISWSDFAPVGNELQYLQDAFASGWVSGGQYVERLEALVGEIFEGSSPFAVSNGTIALQLAFQAFELRPGDEVVVPAFCFQAASNVLRQLGAKPVFCDVDPLTWNQTVETMEAVITPGTVGVVVVHNYGAAAPSAEIRNWADRRGIWMIEDCAEAWFSSYKGRLLGQFGQVATFSMHATKPIASGEGGMVLLNDSQLSERVRLLRSHGLNRQSAHYLHLLAGNNYRLSNLLCAVAYGQMECREQIVAEQQQRLEWYAESLRGHWAFELQHSLSESDDNIWAVAVRIPFALIDMSRDELMAAMKEAGIETRPGFYAASALAYHADSAPSCPVADSLHGEIIVLPCSPKLTKDSVKLICNELIRIVGMRTKAGVGVSADVLDKSSAAVARVAAFDSRLIDGRSAFRYFDKRRHDVVLAHDRTVMLKRDGKDVGYGHLETENGITWLGIAVADSERGKGLGKILMRKLLGEAAAIGRPEVRLRVDTTNLRGIQLYRQCGFVDLSQGDNSSSLLMVKHVLPSRSLFHALEG
jgi:perosamine synthetase